MKKISHRKRRRRRMVVSNVRRRRLSSAARRARKRGVVRRRNPARRSHRRRRKYSYQVGHTIRRVRINPGNPNSIMLETVGAVGAALAESFLLPKMANMMPATTTANTKTIVTAAAGAGIGFGAYKLLQKSNPALGRGILIGSLSAAVLNLVALATNNAVQRGMAGGGSGGYGYGGTGYTGGQVSQGAAAYLGAAPARPGMRRRRRMRGRGMGAYLAPGQPIQSLVGPVTPTAPTFGNQPGAIGIGSIYTGGKAFPDAWARN